MVQVVSHLHWHPCIRQTVRVGFNESLRLRGDQSDPHLAANQIAYESDEGGQVIKDGRVFSLPTPLGVG
jgi:hypothetical protein